MKKVKFSSFVSLVLVLLLGMVLLGCAKNQNDTALEEVTLVTEKETTTISTDEPNLSLHQEKKLRYMER